MTRKDFIELLNKDRFYHKSHPQEINLKLVYSLAGSFGAIVLGIYIKSSHNDGANISKYFNNMYPNIYLVLVLFLIGLFFIFIGLWEHNSLHSQQRKRIEMAINQILSYKNETDFDCSEFMAKFNNENLEYWKNKKLKTPTPLIAFEPDTRSYWNYHDRKIDFGAVLIIIAYLILIYNAVTP